MQIERRVDGELPFSILMVEDRENEVFFRGHLLLEHNHENPKSLSLDLGNQSYLIYCSLFNIL